LSKVEKLYEPTAALIALDEEVTIPDPDDSDLDDEMGDPIEPILEAGDEATDIPTTPRQPETVALPEVIPPSATSPEGVRRLFAQLQIRREPSGNLIIEAPPEAASTLGALFEGMAAMLRQMGESDRQP
jgi:hypothetical protein